MNKIGFASGAFAAAVLLCIVIGLILAYPIMLLWNNCFVPAINIAEPITWSQSFGLYFLFKFLFSVSVTNSKD